MKQKNGIIENFIKEMESNDRIIVEKIEINIHNKSFNYKAYFKITNYKTRMFKINEHLINIKLKYKTEIKISEIEYFNETGDIITKAIIKFNQKREK